MNGVANALEQRNTDEDSLFRRSSSSWLTNSSTMAARIPPASGGVDLWRPIVGKLRHAGPLFIRQFILAAGDPSTYQQLVATYSIPIAGFLVLYRLEFSHAIVITANEQAARHFTLCHLFVIRTCKDAQNVYKLLENSR